MYAEGEDLASLCQGTLLQQYGWFSDEWDVQRNLRFCNPDLAYAVAMEIECAFKEKGVCHGCIRHGLVVSFQAPTNSNSLLRGLQAIDRLSSACIASILRTFYSWRVAQSPDISYNVMLVGIWAWAEMAVGIIVSCLPIMPKFFQHFSPKIRRVLSLSTGTAERGGATGESYPSHKHQNPFSRSSGRTRIPDVVDESFDLATRDKAQGATVKEYSIASPSDTVFTPEGRTATKREDLEIGRGCNDKMRQSTQYTHERGRSNWDRGSVGW